MIFTGSIKNNSSFQVPTAKKTENGVFSIEKFIFVMRKKKAFVER